jgi:hypothetical protein
MIPDRIAEAGCFLGLLTGTVAKFITALKLMMGRYQFIEFEQRRQRDTVAGRPESKHRADLGRRSGVAQCDDRPELGATSIVRFAAT